LRTLAFRRVIIAYFVDRHDPQPGMVTIAGVFYGGQDYETILADDDAP
jgi:plasmid stabilization system protein ParE